MHDRRPPSAVQFMVSQADLTNYKTVTILVDDGSVDNPFKPGTELSWEADMMVGLMRRGYPIQEIPALIEAAKQIVGQRAAKPEGRHQPQQASLSSPSPRPRPRNPATKGGTLPAIVVSRPLGAGERPGRLQRRQSSHELDKQANPKLVWANSLSRAKSVPRQLASETGSIDRLITSIELEMADQLRAGERQISKGRPMGKLSTELMGADAWMDQRDLKENQSANEKQTKSNSYDKLKGGRRSSRPRPEENRDSSMSQKQRHSNGEIEKNAHISQFEDDNTRIRLQQQQQPQQQQQAKNGTVVKRRECCKVQ